MISKIIIILALACPTVGQACDIELPEIEPIELLGEAL